MRKILLIGATLIGAVMLVSTPVSVKWSGLPNISNIVLGIDQAQSRVVIRAVQLVLQESIAVIDVMNGGRGTRARLFALALFWH